MKFSELATEQDYKDLKDFDDEVKLSGLKHGDLSKLAEDIDEAGHVYQCRPLNDSNCRLVEQSMREVGTYNDELSLFVVYLCRVLIDGEWIIVWRIVDGRHRKITLMRLMQGGWEGFNRDFEVRVQIVDTPKVKFQLFN